MKFLYLNVTADEKHFNENQMDKMITKILSQEWKRNGERNHKGLKFVAPLKHIVDSKAESQP